MTHEETKNELSKAAQELEEVIERKDILLQEIWQTKDHTGTPVQEAELESIVKKFGVLNQRIDLLNEQLDLEDEYRLDDWAIIESKNDQRMLKEVLEEMQEIRRNKSQIKDREIER